MTRTLAALLLSAAPGLALAQDASHDPTHGVAEVSVVLDADAATAILDTDAVGTGIGLTQLADDTAFEMAVTGQDGSVEVYSSGDGALDVEAAGGRSVIFAGNCDLPPVHRRVEDGGRLKIHVLPCP